MKLNMNKLRKLVILPIFVLALLVPGKAYAVDYSCTVRIPVQVTISGSGVPTGVEYELVLEAQDASNPMPTENSIKMTDSGSAEFGPITFAWPGNYLYKITQKADAREHFTFDSSEYLVTVFVVNDGAGGLLANIFAENQSAASKAAEIIFANSYYKPPSGTESVPSEPESESESENESESEKESESESEGETESESGLYPLENVLGADFLGGDTGGNTSGVQTADTASASLWTASGAAAAVVIALIMAKRRFLH